MYLQTAIRPDEGFEYAGVKLRCKLRLDEKLAGAIGLAINFEISNVPRQFEPNVWGSEIRPIIDGRWGLFYASFNPIFDIDLNGPQAGLPQFEPAAKVAFDVVHSLALGLEYYGALRAHHPYASALGVHQPTLRCPGLHQRLLRPQFRRGLWLHRPRAVARQSHSGLSWQEQPVKRRRLGLPGDRAGEARGSRTTEGRREAKQADTSMGTRGEG